MKKNNGYWLVLILFFISSPSYAYIDPSAGSLWVQSLIAVFATIGTMIRIYWQKIKLKLVALKKIKFKKKTDRTE